MDTFLPNTTIDDIARDFKWSDSRFGANPSPNAVRWSLVMQSVGDLDLLQPCDEIFEAVMRSDDETKLRGFWEFFSMRHDLYNFFELNGLGQSHVNNYEASLSENYTMRLAEKLTKKGYNFVGFKENWLQ